MLTDLQQGYGESSFVTDCGSPSIYEEPIKCDGCTMCCALFCCFGLWYYRCLVCLSFVLFSSGNKDEKCFPYEKPLLLQVQAPGFHSYGSFSWVLLLITVGLCFILAVASYMKSYMKSKGEGVGRRLSYFQKKSIADSEYAIKYMGEGSVYCFFLRNNLVGWLIVLVTSGVQVMLVSSTCSLFRDFFNILGSRH